MASRPIFDDIDYSAFTSGDMSKQKYVEDPFANKRRDRNQRQQLFMRTSEWVSEMIRIKDGEQGKIVNMSFDERRYLKRIYDTEARSVLLMTSRQTEKSTSLGNRLISLCGMNWYQNVLFVTPSAMQTKVFSSTRIDDIVEISPMVNALRHKALTWNILEKEFITHSRIYLRYAFLNADRIRGLSVNAIFYDEVQDLLKDVIPVIREAASRYRNSLHIYSGTPKSLDNTIESIWAQQSTMCEWVIPCEHHTPWHWIVLGPKNIGKTGPICERCGHAINPEHEKAQWVAMNPDAYVEGYRICRLMVPWYWKPARGTKDPYKMWKSILHALESYPTAQFMNEVMALSYDSGLKPLTRGEVIRACDETDTYMMDEEQVAELAKSHQLYGGIDWGCHDEETRILTERGFVYFRDLTDDDRVAQWDPDTRNMTFVKPKVRIVRDWDQPLLHFKTRGGVDLLVTHTHRMRVGSKKHGTWTTEPASETVKRGGPIQFVGYVNWEGQEVDEFILPGLPAGPGFSGCDERRFPMDLWLAFVGYAVTEGGVCRDGDRFSCVKISQRVPPNGATATKIKQCLDGLGIPYSEFPNPKTGDLNWTIYGKQYWQWYAENLGTTSDTKRLPRWVFGLSRRQLKILFDAMVDGDGYRDPRPNCTSGSFCSTSRGLCEDFQEICIRLGLRCTVSLYKKAEGNRKARWRALYSKGRDHTIKSPKASVEKIPYRGKVYCCAVETGYIVTERNGKIAYQGNSGENAYTVLVVGGYVREDTSFQILYAKRFDGQLADPEPQMKEIIRLINRFRLKYVGCDYGMGFVQNKKLSSIFSPKRIHQFQYAARSTKKIVYKAALHRSIVFRTAVMADIFSAIKTLKIRLPSWEVFKTPYADDLLAIHAEYSDTLKMIKYDKPKSIPDDTFHAILYCMIVSFFDHRRPDIIAPIQEASKEEAAARVAEQTAIEEIENHMANDWAQGGYY